MAQQRGSWKGYCGAARRWYVRDEGGSIVARGDDLDATMAAARAKRPTGQLTVAEYRKDGSRVEREPVTAAAA